MAPTLEAIGTVAFNERDVVVVQARANGFVERLWVRAPLDPVRAGQPLAELYVPDWVAAQEEYLAVVRMQSAARCRDRRRATTHAPGRHERRPDRQVTARGTRVHRLTIDAPRGGIVTELGVREGMAVAMGATLFRINGLAPCGSTPRCPRPPRPRCAQARRWKCERPRSPAPSSAAASARSCPTSMS